MVRLDNSTLQKETKLYDFQNSPFDAKEFAESLMKCMIDNNGIGLAANQCGVEYSIITLRTDPILVMFNPKIVHLSEKTTILDEGCLSYPGLLVKIKRPETVRVRYQGPDGVTYTRTFTGVTSHTFQQMLDKLNGKSLGWNVSRAKLDLARRKIRSK
jgi:peptide deformylase